MMETEHDWKVTPPTSMYDTLYTCSVCKKQHMVSLDNAATSKIPRTGCKPTEDGDK